MGLIYLSPSKGREKFRTYLHFNSKEAILPPGGTICTDIKVYSDSLTEIRCTGGKQLYQQDSGYTRVYTSIIYSHEKSQMRN